MKTDIHPEYKEVTVSCICGHKFQTRSTMEKDFSVEICSECHPFFTGKQKLVDTAGRVDRFRKKYGDNYGKEEEKAKPATPVAEEAPAPEAEEAKPEAAAADNTEQEPQATEEA